MCKKISDNTSVRMLKLDNLRWKDLDNEAKKLTAKEKKKVTAQEVIRRILDGKLWMK
jgi:hypothetical protein